MYVLVVKASPPLPRPDFLGQTAVITLPYGRSVRIFFLLLVFATWPLNVLAAGEPLQRTAAAQGLSIRGLNWEDFLSLSLSVFSSFTTAVLRSIGRQMALYWT